MYNNESYSLVLNSQTSNNIINNTNLSSVQYNINWNSILPQKYKRYNVTFQCKSNNSPTVGFAASCPGTTTLTVSSVFSGEIFIGMRFWFPNSIFTITSFGTGTGGIGTYIISGQPTITANTLLYSTNTLFLNNVICSINFGSNNTIENNSSSNKIGVLYPSTFPVHGNNMFTSNLGCTSHDNGPIDIYYPSYNNITVSFNYIDGTPVTRMTHYNLQLYFEPIIEDIKDINENKQNLLSGSY
jgi:hypothetical protein